MKEAQTVTDFADASHSKSAKSTATTVLYGIFRSENSYLCAMTKHVQYTLLLYIRKATVYNNYRSFAVGYCSRLAQTVTDFADASHSKSAKSTTTTVLYGIFSSENSYPCTGTCKDTFKKIHKKYWNCMRYSVIMSLSCIVRCIVNYNYSENSLIKWE